MKWLRIAGWLVLTLVAMRLVSWALAWVAGRLLRLDARFAAILANLTAFLLFVLLLYEQLEPGEPVDRAAVVFGAVVFLIYLAIDWFWMPWKTRARGPASVAPESKQD
jgi:hypothetical protein